MKNNLYFFSDLFFIFSKLGKRNFLLFFYSIYFKYFCCSLVNKLLCESKSYFRSILSCSCQSLGVNFGVAAAFILFEKVALVSFLIVFSSLGIILILISIFTFNENTAFPSLLTLIPTLGTMLVIIFSSRETIVYKLLSIPFLVKIGLISYSIYLWHQPILAFSREIFGYDLTTISLILLLILSGIFGFLCGRFIEKPFRDKSFLSQRKYLD